MKKADYLAQPEVLSFIAWWAPHLAENSALGHHYVKPGAELVEFANLADALQKYDWKFGVEIDGQQVSGSTFKENCAALARLKSALGAAGGDVCKASIGIVTWGGVRNGNVRWLLRNERALADILARTAKVLQAGDDDRALFERGLRFNAGMTKVYSLLIDNFIIYDSRLAAALAWFVMTWMRKMKQAAIPDALNFPWMPAKEGINPEIRKQRNAGIFGCEFQKMGNRPSLHAHWNLRASWIIEAVCARAKDTPFHAGAEPMRAIEAALFMWGYDLGRNMPWLKEQQRAAANDDDAEEEPAAAADPSAHAGYQLVTRGPRALAFWWRFDEAADRISIQRANGMVDNFEVGATFFMLHDLYDRFDQDMIPLANNVVQVQNGTARDGLAMAIYQMPKSTPQLAQAASYLGPVMEAVGLFGWNQKNRNIAFYFREAPPASIQDLRDTLSEFAR